MSPHAVAPSHREHRRRGGIRDEPGGFATAKMMRALRRRGAVLAAAAALLGAMPAMADVPRSTIVFGGDIFYPPFEWLGEDAVEGFYVELADAVAESGGLAAEHRLAPWPDTIGALESGTVDAVVMFDSEARRQKFLFTPPFHYVNHGIYARSDFGSIAEIQDLGGHKVAVEELSFAHEQLASLRVDLVLETDTLAALRAVAEQRADYAVLSAPTANYLIADHDMALRNVGPPIWPSSYSFAVRADRPELIRWLTNQLNEVLRSGVYHEIYRRWENQLVPTGLPRSNLSVTLGWALLPLASVAMLAGGLLLRRRVTDRNPGLDWPEKRTGGFGGRTGTGEDRHEASGDAPGSAIVESETTWGRDFDVDTQLPRLHHFTSRVDDILAASDPAAETKLVVALRPADLERTLRTLGHEAALASVKDLARRLLSMELAVYGSSGRDVFLVFDDKAKIDATLRSMASHVDTLVVCSDPDPLLFVGSSKWPADGCNAGELIRRAETALAAAVQRREKWVEYRSTMEPDSTDLQLLRLFRETAGEGLFAVFQPQVDVRTGQIVGAEALARWEAPGIGPVPPGKFIPLLEEAGLIRHVTSRMMAQAVRVAAALRLGGFPCPISVNVAVADLLGNQSSRTLFKAMKRHGGQPSDLKLELTETSFAENAETVRWVMTKLRDSGIRLSIDDFGTGYSSLSYLSDFPIHEIKIDQSFVRRLDGDPQHRSHNRSIIRSTIAMAHELGLVVVAEGVETEAAMSILREDGCDRAQGYLVSQPLHEAQFVRFVQAAAGTPAARHAPRANRAKRL